MTSRRSNLLGVVLGAFLSIAALGTANAQVPRSISYQGLLIKNGQPVNAQASLKINIYNAAGTLLYTESYNQVQVNNGVFNVNIGASTGLANLKFDEQYFLGVEVDGTPEIMPHTPFTAAPYALNAQTVGGIGVSTTPAPGMLLPLDQNGKIPTSVLPQATSLVSVNGLTGDSLGNVQILGVNGITVLSDAITNKITIGMATTGGIVDTIYPGPGIDVINPIGTQHTVQIANNGITPGMIGTGAVLGRNLDQNIPQLGLYQDALGDLNIGINSTLTYINPPGNHAIGINLANPNTWTGTQTFSASPIGIIVTTTAQFNGPVVITGTPEPAAAVNGATYELQLNGDFRATGSTTIQGNTFIGAGPTNTTNTIGNVTSQPANSVLGLTNTVTAQSTGATAATNTISASGTASGNSNNITASGTGASNNIQAPTNNVGTTNSGSTNTIGNAGTSTNTVTGATNNVTGTTANNVQAPANNIGTTNASSTNTIGNAGTSTNTVTGATNNVTGTTANNVQAPANNIGTTNASSINTIGNAGTSTNTVTGATNNVTGTTANNVQAPTNNMGTTQAVGGVNNVGTLATSTNNISGVTNNIQGQTNNIGTAQTVGGSNTVGTAGVSTTTIHNNVNIGSTGTSPNNTINVGSAANNSTVNIAGLTATMNATTNNVGTNAGSTNNIGSGTSTNTVNGTTTFNGTHNINGNTTIVGSLSQSGGNANLVGSASNSFGTFAGSSNTIGNSGTSSNTITGLNNTITAAVAGSNTINGTTNVNGNETVNGNLQVNGTVGSTGNATLGTNSGTNNTVGNAGTSNNTVTGLNNSMIATNTNTITANTNNMNGVLNQNGAVNITGNTAITGTLSNTGNLNLGTASTTNSFGGASSSNRFNGTSNFGTLPASNGNKLIIDGAPNLALPVAPSGIPTGFNIPTDFEGIVNGDFSISGWTQLNNATVNGTLWVNGAIVLPPSASFCVSNVQVQTLSSWCSTPTAPITVATAFNQNSLNGNANNTFLASNFNGAVNITGNTAITGTLSSTGNTTLASTPGSTATLGNTTGATTINGSSITNNGNTTINGTTTHAGTIVQTLGTTTLLNTQVNGTLGSTGNITLATTSSTNVIGQAGVSSNTLQGLTNNLNGTNNLTGVLNQNGNSNFTGGVSTFTNNNINLVNSNIVGNNANTNISQIVNVQTGTITIGNTLNQQTTVQSTNSTGAPITQKLAQVGGQIPVFLVQRLALNPATLGPNGGASVTFNFGANAFDGTDAITVSYYSRANNQFGQIYISAQNPAAGTIQIESTNPLDQNVVQVQILRD